MPWDETSFKISALDNHNWSDIHRKYSGNVTLFLCVLLLPGLGRQKQLCLITGGTFTFWLRWEKKELFPVSLGRKRKSLRKVVRVLSSTVYPYGLCYIIPHLLILGFFNWILMILVLMIWHLPTERWLRLQSNVLFNSVPSAVLHFGKFLGVIRRRQPLYDLHIAFTTIL